MTHYLHTEQRPHFEGAPDPLRVVDLFSGCGGISLGIAQAALSRGRGAQIALAVDVESSATEVYRKNFPDADRVDTIDVGELFSLRCDAELSRTERHLRAVAGSVDLLAGGPPCQGHSSLNNHTRGDDPKNALYRYMARAAKVFSPTAVLIENVPTVVNDRFGGESVVARTTSDLEELGFDVSTTVIRAQDHGVAQTRKRHVLIAVKSGLSTAEQVLERLLAAKTDPLTVRQALDKIVPDQESVFDRPPNASSTNLERMLYLHSQGEVDLPNHLRPKCQQGPHSYKSMYGRLSWDKPAQTITSGFGSIGQGRFMHPAEIRALTPHEAARLQGFPDYFDFRPVRNRATLSRMIGNAVPPPVAQAIAGAMLDEGLFPEETPTSLIAGLGGALRSREHCTSEAPTTSGDR